MGKGIGRIYKYDQRNWTYPSPNTTLIITPNFDTSIQNLRYSASDASTGANDETSYGLDTSIQNQLKSTSDPSAGENDVSSDVLYQSTNHNCNTDIKNNGDSQLYETPQKKY